MKLYVSFAARIRAMIDEGVLRPGDKIFSVRQASQKYGLSISTVLRGYLLLEQEGIISSHPQSGYYVTPRKRLQRHETSPLSKDINLSEVDASKLVLTTLKSIREFGTVPLGSPFPDPQLFPLKKIHQYEKALTDDEGEWGVLSDLPPGNEMLRQQIARRYLANGMDVSPDDIVITHGATEAITLCLQAVAKAGDVIALESPGYYALAHTVERLGMKVAELRTDPDSGIDLDALRATAGNVRIAAVILTANFQNPLGFVMPDAKKQALVAFLEEQQIPLIEDDVYGELYFSETAPKPAKAFDRSGLVLHCASFSKSLAPGYRVGWTVAGRYRQEVERLMFLNSLSMPSAPQIAIAKFMQRDSFERHLKQLRHTLRSQYVLIRNVIEESFPAGTQLSAPKGGYVIWVNLPAPLDALKLYRAAIDNGITVAPGTIFSRKKDLTHYIRLNFSHLWTLAIEQAVRQVGALACGMLADAGNGEA
ncbi:MULTISPECIES: PLP-dependent aminotransferase family protein [Methylobacillus]|uniref:Transcriptional regulator, GntR family n=1 Tax=Methylobacillus flagellatus (strain ATCC 51484 / DSM 6875 / VKM B-1610 / KT) TaxID=265072 RepID=Q1H4I0_METFK|nr:MULTISPECIES: PLP-dependent aminotransferase family protein [Methylobacillus]ABE48607.1 transcriptional regulator, GntR family [Methylobacillus flagellatus KT]MPS49263.1 PLP-dependent aminotransferase family protein [Methylobacillus sp.]